MKSKRTILKAAATLVAAAFSFPAVAGCNTAKPPADLFTEKDAWRFSQLVESRTRGLALAVSSDRTADRKKLSEALVDLYPDKDEERPKHAADRLVGSYGCSIIKLGGLPPLVAYQAFRCEIHSGKNGLVLKRQPDHNSFTAGSSLRETGLPMRVRFVTRMKQQHPMGMVRNVTRPAVLPWSLHTNWFWSFPIRIMRQFTTLLC